MDELVTTVSTRLGIPPEKAAMAVQLVLDHLKAKAPALSSQIDGLLGEGGGGDAGGLGGKLGGLLGND